MQFIHSPRLTFATLLFTLACAALVPAQTAAPKKGAPDAASQQSAYPDCEKRHPSVSMEECAARMKLADLAPLPECKTKTGQEYRQCAAQVPTKLTPNPYLGMTAEQKSMAGHCSQKMQLGDSCSTEEAAQYARWRKELDAEFAAENRERDCLSELRVGDSAKKVAACGPPLRVNGELVDETEQLVYPYDFFIYIRKGLVVDVQWLSPN